MTILSNKFSVIAAASGLALCAGSALAGPSSSAELRGYSNCMDAAAEQSNGLATNRSYLLNSTPQEKQYYINASRWEQGDRVQVRIACETSANGRILVSQTIDQGRFEQQRGRVSVEIANL